MNMGTLLGAVVGSLVGVGGWFYMETTYPRDYSWAAIVIGGLAGLFARWCSKAGPGAIARGALTAAIALGCMVGGRFAITKQIETLAAASVEANKAAQADRDADAKENQEEEDTDESNKGEIVEEEPRPKMIDPEAFKASQGATNRGATQPPFYLAAYYVIGTLLAYFIGKGREQADMIVSAGGSQPSESDDMT